MPLTNGQIIEIVGGVALAYATMKAWNKIVFLYSVRCKMDRAETVRILDLRSLLQSESGHSKEKLVLVSGVVKGILKNQFSPHNVLESEETTCTGVVLEQTWASVRPIHWIYWLIDKSWTSDKSTTLKTIPFVLSGNQGGRDYVVVNLEGSTHPIPLTTLIHRAHSKFYKEELPIGEFFFGSVLLEEKLLQFGTTLNAVGICSLKDGYPQIKSCQELPYFLTDVTKDEMLKHLTLQKDYLIALGFILGLLSFGFLSHHLQVSADMARHS